MKVGGRNGAHGMKDKIQPSPTFDDGIENAIEFVRHGDVAGKDDRRFEPRRQWRHIGSGAFIEIGHTKFGTGLAEMHGCGPRQTAIIRDAEDNTLATGQIEQFHGIAAFGEVRHGHFL